MAEVRHAQFVHITTSSLNKTNFTHVDVHLFCVFSHSNAKVGIAIIFLLRFVLKYLHGQVKEQYR